jgi:DNA-directed RNA polymerase specialized sigma24 family protein
MRSRPLPLAGPRRPVAEPRCGPRAAVARALSCCAARERVLLALLLFERLTPAEAASVLDVPAWRIERAYASLLVELRESLGTRAPYPMTPVRTGRPVATLRRAS